MYVSVCECVKSIYNLHKFVQSARQIDLKFESFALSEPD